MLAATVLAAAKTRGCASSHRPTYPGIVDDYRSTFAKAMGMTPDVLLGPHPEVYGMQAKRAQLKDGAPNPFVKPGKLKAM